MAAIPITKMHKLKNGDIIVLTDTITIYDKDWTVKDTIGLSYITDFAIIPEIDVDTYIDYAIIFIAEDVGFPIMYLYDLNTGDWNPIEQSNVNNGKIYCSPISASGSGLHENCIYTIYNGTVKYFDLDLDSDPVVAILSETFEETIGDNQYLIGFDSKSVSNCQYAVIRTNTDDCKITIKDTTGEIDTITNISADIGDIEIVKICSSLSGYYDYNVICIGTLSGIYVYFWNYQFPGRERLLVCDYQFVSPVMWIDVLGYIWISSGTKLYKSNAGYGGSITEFTEFAIVDSPGSPYINIPDSIDVMDGKYYYDYNPV